MLLRAWYGYNFIYMISPGLQYDSHCIMILTGPPSSPQALMSRVLESNTNYSIVEVTWEPPDNNSKVDFYHYQVVVDLEGTSYTLYESDVKTTNTTVVLSILPNNVNITFFLSTTDSCGRKSIPVALFMNIIGKSRCSLMN